MDAVDNIIDAINQTTSNHSRILIALAGPPTSGKSTVSAKIQAALGDDLAILPMDGFHLDNQILETKGLSTRKGSPPSFDAQGFVHMIKRVQAGEDVYAPSFDRSLDLSRAASIEISTQKYVLVEGNYLLLDEHPWSQLPPLWDVSIWLDVSLETIEARATERWLAHDHSLEAAKKRARENDCVNAKYVMERSLQADFVIKNE